MLRSECMVCSTLGAEGHTEKVCSRAELFCVCVLTDVPQFHNDVSDVPLPVQSRLRFGTCTKWSDAGVLGVGVRYCMHAYLRGLRMAPGACAGVSVARVFLF